MMSESPQPWRDLYEEWFVPSPPLPKPALVKRWFVADAAFDAALGRFEPLLLEARVEAWRIAPEGALAAVVLLDQLPRNLYRGTARAFAWDARALAEAKQAIAQAHDRRVEPLARAFFYLPFEHDETMASQDEAVRRFRTLLDDMPAEDRPLGEMYLDFAERHRDVVARFGRFPHRNAALGRVSTPEELEYLAQPGAGF
jgi:uncharacterized protein (DUF924 family)